MTTTITNEAPADQVDVTTIIPLPDSAIDTAARHLRDILSIAFEYAPPHSAVVVFDSGCELALALTAAYRRCLPDATFIDFDALAPELIVASFAPLVASDLVVLIQSTSF